MTSYLLVLAVGLAAGALSGTIGTGSTIVLLPVLALQFGPQEAVPTMAIAGLMSIIGKVLAWWQDVDWRACFAYSILGVPAAALGARTILILPPSTINLLLGLFFLMMIPGQRLLSARNGRLQLWHLALIGGAIGFLGGIVASTGPLSIPAFRSYGLVKGAFLSTEAASSLGQTLSKVATFWQSGALPYSSILKGLTVGASVMAGSFVGRAIVQRMSIGAYERILDGLLLCAGLAMFWAAATS
jgi:uncharacterized membrane protein YfcA